MASGKVWREASAGHWCSVHCCSNPAYTTRSQSGLVYIDWFTGTGRTWRGETYFVNEGLITRSN